MSISIADSQSSDAFAELMTQHQASLYAYLLSLTANSDIANDVLQETNVVLWREWRQYEPGTRFGAWARRIAHFQFMTFRQKQLRDRVFFDDDVVASLAVAGKQVDDHSDEHTDAQTTA
ncbi:MAG: RNA polymerase subunit sigma, partial [Planctomycetales bacterium]|nr:RNA polymerase subunit sigma [Planctomycetales bacterium]